MNIACQQCRHLNAEDARFCANPDCQERLWADAVPPHEPVHSERRPEPPRARPVEQRGGLHITVETSSLAVDPGKSVTTTVRVHNTGTQMDPVTVSVDGSAREWASVEPESFTVYPDTEMTATVRFAPPHAPGSAAGPRWYTVRVSSGVHPGVGDTVEGNLAVGAFHDVGAELIPRETRGRWRRTTHAVRLTNGGNVLEQVGLEAVDDDETLTFVLPDEETTLAPGAVTTVDLRVRAPRRWIGRPRTHPFHVTASPRGPLEPHRMDGSRVAVPLLSKWMGLAALVALLVAAAAIVLPHYLASAQPGPAPVASAAASGPTPAPPPGAKPPEAKPPEAKPPEAKPPEAKPPQAKPPSKAADAKPAPPPAVAPKAPAPAPAPKPAAPAPPTFAVPAPTQVPVIVPPPTVTTTTATTPPPPPPMVVAQGPVEMADPSSIDLDRGMVTAKLATAEDPDADLDLETIDGASGVVVAPRNDTKVVLGGVGDPSPDQCKDLTPSTDPVPAKRMNLGSVLCVVTDQSHLAVVRIDRIPDQGVTLKATFSTFEKP